MGTVVVRNSVAKRVIVTLMPAISFLCMFGLAAISVNFLEYGSTADRIVGYIGVSCIIPMIVSIPFIFKVNREKTVLDINTFYVTPFVGRTKNIPVQDVKVCTIGRRKQIRLFDEKSNLICKYKGTLSGYWSRRIDKFNRIIYTIEEEIVTVTIISAKGHYGDK